MAAALESILSTVSKIEHELAAREALAAANDSKLDAVKSSFKHFSKTKSQLAGNDPQRLKEVMQTEQLLRAACLPRSHQRAHAVEFHAQGLSRDFIARSVNWTQPLTRAATRVKARQISDKPSCTDARPPVPTIVQARELVKFVKSSPHARRMPLSKIAATLGLESSDIAIRNALGRYGYKLYPAVVRPYINEDTRKLRLEFALNHVNWTIEQWNKVLFTAEVRIPLTDAHEPLVIRQSEEEYNLDCINNVPTEPTTCNDMSCFSPTSQVSREKALSLLGVAMRTTNSAPSSPVNHYKVIFPGFSKWINDQPSGSRFAMRPDMCAHAAVAVKDEMRGRFMPTEHFPPASPDLNPITEIFNWVKANLKADKERSLYGEVAEWRIRQVVRDTWNNIPQENLKALIESMPRRCQAVIDANGMYTRD
ncbi:related to transposable element TCB2 transposase [Fusarium fujikuroi IMI 58289]|uniref:Related to transposable element TCB2 transposase n=1 Tax=Gibberella fujikuroi (strain CBS 195.34 / IMI 58289 / NRRL A-6831) TaxID=1279085 RepID=S0E7G6_GIBF5|nr:LOW QUALITY PROTEIN: related to transposable element TCB2 transposase [Fusarium fujikuroi IMI 58289]CCT70806.1 related to transposable element TCB2 transposase [Fusarium fujikuroi IMI 58289]